MSYLRIILFLTLVSLSLAAIGKEEKTFGWMGDILFGNCDTATCRYDTNRARDCCNSGRNTRCCSYVGGGGWNNGGNYNNNKPGSCPSYNGRRKRSPEDAPWASNSGGRHYGGGGWNNGGGGWNNGGGGWNNGGYNSGYGGGRYIRD